MSIPTRFEDYSRRCSHSCGVELSFAENYAGMGHIEGYEARVHVLVCPECGAEWEVECPE